jgi:hypothetical protein
VEADGSLEGTGGGAGDRVEPGLLNMPGSITIASILPGTCPRLLAEAELYCYSTASPTAFPFFPNPVRERLRRP